MSVKQALSISILGSQPSDSRLCLLSNQTYCPAHSSAEIPLEFLAFSITLQSQPHLSIILSLILTTKTLWVFSPHPLTSVSLFLSPNSLVLFNIYLQRGSRMHTNFTVSAPCLKTYCLTNTSAWHSGAAAPPSTYSASSLYAPAWSVFFLSCPELCKFPPLYLYSCWSPGWDVQSSPLQPSQAHCFFSAPAQVLLLEALTDCLSTPFRGCFSVAFSHFIVISKCLSPLRIL